MVLVHLSAHESLLHNNEPFSANQNWVLLIKIHPSFTNCMNEWACVMFKWGSVYVRIVLIEIRFDFSSLFTVSKIVYGWFGSSRKYNGISIEEYRVCWWWSCRKNEPFVCVQQSRRLSNFIRANNVSVKICFSCLRFCLTRFIWQIWSWRDWTHTG